MKEFRISREDAGRRLDKWLMLKMPSAKKGFLYKMLRKKNITVNDRRAFGNETLTQDDVIRIYFSDETFERFSSGRPEINHVFESDMPDSISSELKPQILYEDKDVLIINKPAGMLSQKVHEGDYSVNEWLHSYLSDKFDSSDKSGVFRPSVCHRLDRNTSGILVCGISYRGLKEMTELIRQHSVRKEYLCLVRGVPKKEFILKNYLIKDEKTNTVSVLDVKSIREDSADIKGAMLHAKTLAVAEAQKKVGSYGQYTGSGGTEEYSNEMVSLLLVELLTGRSHQIRAQLAHIGHPIIGDRKYGDGNLCTVKPFSFERQVKRPMLHSYRMIFEKKNSDASKAQDYRNTLVSPAREIIAPVPDDMKKLMMERGILWPHGIPEA